MNKFTCEFIKVLQQDISKEENIPLDFEVIFKTREKYHHKNSLELKSLMEKVANNFGYNIITFEETVIMESKSICAKLCIDSHNKGSVIVELNWSLAELISQEEYSHLCDWDVYGRFDVVI